MKKPYAIVLDSSSGESYNKDKPNIHIYPLIITVNSKDYTDNNVDLTFDELYELQKNFSVKTSQGNTYQLEIFMEKILEDYEKVYFLPISSEYSGLKNSAVLLSKDQKFLNKLQVFETHTIFFGLKRLAKILVPEFDKVSSFETIQSIIDEDNKNFTMVFVPNDIGYLRKGGRVGKTGELLANLLKLKPVLELNKSIEVLKKVRTFNTAWDEGLIYLKNSFIKNDKFKAVMLSSSKNEIINQFCREEINNILGTNIESYTIITNSVLAHVGPETVGIFVEKVE